jgi:hypothetical protein
MGTSDYLKLVLALHLWKDPSIGLPNKWKAKTTSKESEDKPMLKKQVFYLLFCSLENSYKNKKVNLSLSTP